VTFQLLYSFFVIALNAATPGGKLAAVAAVRRVACLMRLPRVAAFDGESGNLPAHPLALLI